MLKLDNLRSWEKVELVLRRHWIVFVILWLHAFVWLIINIILYSLFWAQLWVNIFTLIYLMWFIVFIYIEWINHELDMYVITNSRIIWIEQIGFLNREVSQCALNDVQEVNSKTKWFFANMLNYWDLTIQTAWNASNFRMEYVPDSLKASRQVLNIVEEYKWELNKKGV
jgi:hypothetical protein